MINDNGDESNRASLDETRLIRSLKHGSTRAFETIYHMYFRRLYNYCYQFTKSHSDAEDIVQEAFTNLWISRDKIKQENSLRGRLFTMVRSRLVNAFRRMVSAPLLEDYMDYVNTLGSNDTDMVEYKEFQQRLMDLISQLPPSKRNILELSRFRQLTNKEIADKLGINEQSVKNSISQSLKFIRSRLTDVWMIILLAILK